MNVKQQTQAACTFVWMYGGLQFVKLKFESSWQHFFWDDISAESVVILQLEPASG